MTTCYYIFGRYYSFELPSRLQPGRQARHRVLVLVHIHVMLHLIGARFGVHTGLAAQRRVAAPEHLEVDPFKPNLSQTRMDAASPEIIATERSSPGLRREQPCCGCLVLKHLEPFLKKGPRALGHGDLPDGALGLRRIDVALVDAALDEDRLSPQVLDLEPEDLSRPHPFKHSEAEDQPLANREHPKGAADIGSSQHPAFLAGFTLRRRMERQGRVVFHRAL